MVPVDTRVGRWREHGKEATLRATLVSHPQELLLRGPWLH